MSLERVAIVSVSGLFIGFLRYVIKERKVMWIIAEHDPRDVHDVEGFAEFMGTRLYLVMILMNNICVYIIITGIMGLEWNV